MNLENLDLKSKTELRAAARKIRANLDIALISSKIYINFREQDFYKFSKNILVYYPFNNEIDLREFYKDNSKNWYLPRVDMYSRKLVIHKYKYGDTLAKNKWGILEPLDRNEIINPEIIDIVVIPALMADKKGFRLGYGAGFYDKFIPCLRADCLKIIPVPEELFIDSLPYDNWDIRANIIITQKNYYFKC